MISILCIVIALILLCIAINFSKAIWIRYAVVFVFMAFLIEMLIFGYFCVQIGKGTCFFLIGQEKSLDALIKLRLSYAMYFVQGKKSFINHVDGDLGYSLGKDKDTGLYQTNRQGFRANREYSLFPDDAHLRMVTLGDSFVFCDGERNADTWPFILEGLSDHLEVLNFGVPGYGLGQSYLRYLKYAREYHPDIVFVNYAQFTNRDKIDRQEIVGLDNLRLANFYRVHFWIENGILKTRSMSPYDMFDADFRKEFLFDEKQLLNESHLGFLQHITFCNTGILVKEMIVRRIMVKKQITNSKADDDRIEYKILSDFLQTVQKDGSQIIFFYGLDFTGLSKNIQDLFLANESFVTYVNSNQAISEQIAQHSAQSQNLKNSENHYNHEGNRYYAETVLKVLKLRSHCRGKKCFQL